MPHWCLFSALNPRLIPQQTYHAGLIGLRELPYYGGHSMLDKPDDTILAPEAANIHLDDRQLLALYVEWRSVSTEVRDLTHRLEVVKRRKRQLHHQLRLP